MIKYTLETDSSFWKPGVPLELVCVNSACTLFQDKQRHCSVIFACKRQSHKSVLIRLESLGLYGSHTVEPKAAFNAFEVFSVYFEL